MKCWGDEVFLCAYLWWISVDLLFFVYFLLLFLLVIIWTVMDLHWTSSLILLKCKLTLLSHFRLPILWFFSNLFLNIKLFMSIDKVLVRQITLLNWSLFLLKSYIIVLVWNGIAMCFWSVDIAWWFYQCFTRCWISNLFVPLSIILSKWNCWIEVQLVLLRNWTHRNLFDRFLSVVMSLESTTLILHRTVVNKVATKIVV